MRRSYLAWIIGLLISCGGGDDGPPTSPEGATLIFPLQDSECTAGVDIGEDLSQVTFEWEPAKNTNRYTLTVINLSSNTPQAITTASTSAALSIAKGAPFSWSVLSTNNGTDETATSESWLFYNAGSQTTYAPFPAQINSPKAGSTVQANTNAEIILKWSGADVEDDIVNFEVFLSTDNPPTALISTVNADITEAAVNVISGQIYYWKIVTKDAEGNTSDSGVFDFKVF